MQNSPFKRILVTGATGFLGPHVVAALKAQLKAEIIGVGRKDFDLLKPGQAELMLEKIKPDAVVHLAARVGGIIADMTYPADFFYENLFINTTVFEASYRAGIKKFVTAMGGCAYPAKAHSPIAEEAMWNGYPQFESAPYSIAKKVIIVQSESYRRQHGFNSVVLIPGNIYGEHDNFNEEYSHVIPAMIRRFLEAREKGAPTITCYGSGKPTRDFVYAQDVADLFPWFLLNYDSSDTVNISTGTRITIRELAETVKEVTGYQGTITWDTSKPDGQMDKIFSVERLHKLGLNCPTTLREGLRKTMDWFAKARVEGTVRL
jgi:GDP-L-fucose synthase